MAAYVVKHELLIIHLSVCVYALYPTSLNPLTYPSTLPSLSTTTERSAQREAALKEVKERAKALKAKQAKTKPTGAAAGGSKQASKTKTAVKARGTQR